MATTTEEGLLRNLIEQIAAARGMKGSEILIGGGTPDVSTPGRLVIAIQSCGTTYKLGPVLGNCDGINNKTFLAPFIVEGQFTSVTAGADSTDQFIVYFGN
jgi:hypothetical protein